MNEKEKQFVQGCFHSYYQRAMPAVPALSQREMGFGWEKKIDYRHKAFSSALEFERFVLQQAPLFMSYSTAYYRFPDKMPMHAKEFQGADLVFDLDAARGKHEHQPVFCALCLEDIHKQALRVLSFLKDDFGLEGSLVFSGQKGFHVHVRSEKVLDLSKEARRQMAEYVSAEGIASSSFFGAAASESDSTDKRVDAMHGPSEKSGGWAAQIYGAMRRAIMEKDEPALKAFGVRGKHRADALKRPDEMLEQLRAGNWAAFCSHPNVEALLESVKAVQTDKAVTFDLARLIRVPNSLHGGTGFVAKPILKPEEFKVEDVLAFSLDEAVRVIPKEPLAFEFAGQKWDLPRARFAEVPLPIGIFLVCQDKAFVP